MTPVTLSEVISNRNEPYLIKESISLLPSHFESRYLQIQSEYLTSRKYMSLRNWLVSYVKRCGLFLQKEPTRGTKGERLSAPDGRENMSRGNLFTGALKKTRGWNRRAPAADGRTRSCTLTHGS